MGVSIALCRGLAMLIQRFAPICLLENQERTVCGDFVPNADEDLLDGPRTGRRHFQDDFVGFDLDQRLVKTNQVSGFDYNLGYLRLGSVADFGNPDLDGAGCRRRAEWQAHRARGPSRGSERVAFWNQLALAPTLFADGPLYHRFGLGYRCRRHQLVDLLANPRVQVLPVSHLLQQRERADLPLSVLEPAFQREKELCLLLRRKLTSAFDPFPETAEIRHGAAGGSGSGDGSGRGNGSRLMAFNREIRARLSAAR